MYRETEKYRKQNSRLAQNIFGETVASLEVVKIKEHLYKNWKFK